jgi:hypothetical protein
LRSSTSLPPGHYQAAADAAVRVSNIELISKKEILDFQPAPRLEQVGDKRPKQMNHGKHRMR